MKKHYSNNKSKAATKSGGVGVIVKFVAILLAVLGVAYVITSLALNKQWNPLKWGKKVETTQQGDGNSDSGNVDTDDKGLINSGENKGILLKSRRLAAAEFEDYGIDAQANTAYSVTATVNEDAADKSVIGSVSWKNASSEWASGKNISDYATLNQTEQYGLSFTLTVKQAFGEPVMIKVAACTDSGVYGTAQVDYLKELVSFTAVLNPSYSASAFGRINVGTNTNTVQITPNYGVGTLTGTISNYKTTFTVNDFTKTRLKSALNSSSASSFFVTNYIVAEGSTFKIPFLNGKYYSTGSYGSLLNGGGNPAPPQTIANNFIKSNGCGDSTGSSSSTAGVTRIEYEITYSYGDEYSVTKTYRDTAASDMYSDNPTTTIYGFRNDNLSVINTINEINVAPDAIIVYPE